MTPEDYKRLSAELSAKPTLFCTRCAATIENFCFSEGVKNVEAVKKTLAQCREQGRFSGDFCAKLFIASAADPGPAFPPVEDEE